MCRNYICNPFATFDFIFHPSEGVVIRGDVGDDGFLVGSRCVHVLGVEETWNSELRVGHIEGVIEVVNVLAMLQFRPHHQVGSVWVDESVETQASSPRNCKQSNPFNTLFTFFRQRIYQLRHSTALAKNVHSDLEFFNYRA